MPLIDLEEGGGGIQSFTGKIVDAFFTENEYGLSLMLKSAFDDPENYVKFEDGCFTRYYPCGPKWSTPDGETAVHPDGDTKRFNSGTKVGQLCAALNNVPGIETAAPSDFSPYRAASWKGLHLTWGQVPVTRRRMKKNEDGTDTGTWESYEATELLPVAVAGGVAPSSNGAAAIDVATLGLTTEQLNDLSKLAQTADTDGKFLEGIVKVTGAMSNTAFMGAVSKDTAGVKRALAESLL